MTRTIKYEDIIEVICDALDHCDEIVVDGKVFVNEDQAFDKIEAGMILTMIKHGINLKDPEFGN